MNLTPEDQARQNRIMRHIRAGKPLSALLAGVSLSLFPALADADSSQDMYRTAGVPAPPKAQTIPTPKRVPCKASSSTTNTPIKIRAADDPEEFVTLGLIAEPELQPPPPEDSEPPTDRPVPTDTPADPE